MHLIKHASVLLAIALAVRVLPVPGGPYNKTPLGGSIPKLINFSGEIKGNSRTSLNLLSYSLHPPISLYVTSGFSSTYIVDTVGSTLGGKGIYILYLLLSTPTLIPSSISEGATSLPNPTTNFAIYFKFIKNFGEGVFLSIILVQTATCNGCSFISI